MTLFLLTTTVKYNEVFLRDYRCRRRFRRLLRLRFLGWSWFLLMRLGTIPILLLRLLLLRALVSGSVLLVLLGLFVGEVGEGVLRL